MKIKYRKFRLAVFGIIICCGLMPPALKGQALINTIHFMGSFDPKISDLKRAMNVSPGQLYRQDRLAGAAKSLEKYLTDNGFLFARVDSLKAQYNRDSSEVDILVYGASGERVYIGNIIFRSDSLDNAVYEKQWALPQGAIYRRQAFENELRLLLERAADNGYPFARIMPQPPVLRRNGKTGADFIINIHEGRRTKIDKILLKGNRYTRSEVILRELNLSPGALYVKDNIDQIPERLIRLGIFREVPPPQLLIGPADSIFLQVEVQEGDATTFDGVIGYIPATGTGAEGDGYFTGLLDLSFKNLFGTARKFHVHWKKPDRYSEEFYLDYWEPWLFDYPLDLGAGLERIVRDSTYIEWNLQLKTRLRLTDRFTLVGSVQRRSTIPDSLSSLRLRLARNQVTNLEVGIEYDSRDNPMNPRRGLFYLNSYAYGFKKNQGPDYLLREDSLSRREDLQRLQLRFSWFYNLWKNQVFALNLEASQVKGDRLQLSDLYWFGGSRSLRGYRENQFVGNVIAWTNLEYRFLLGRFSRLFLFNDWGFYQSNVQGQKRQKVLPGFGAGIRLNTPLGIMGVDYGLGRGDSFRQGKIHVGIINRF